jgi:muramidase (phage lysozyme)
MSRDGAISAPQIDLTTNQTGIFALADSHRVVSDGVAYWQNGGEGWYLAESDLTTLSRYDLTARGFESTEANPTSFNHLDGVNQPQGLVRYLYQKLFDVSSKDPRTSHALVSHNYQRLLDKIDRGEKHYSTQEYRLAVQNQSYLEHLQRLCVKHPADGYYSAEDPIWQTFFTPLFKQESPLWYRYSVNFLTATRWMHLVPKMVAEPWYMHPIVFLDAINNISMTIDEARVRAFMRTIRVGEGTVGDVGYETLFGKQSFIKDYHKNFSDHPNILITRGPLTSSAAGAYQVMGYTWNDSKMLSYRKKHGVSDFSPKSQDEFCILILKYKRKGSLKLIIDGDIDGALDILSYEWASLPPARYPQSTKSKSEVMSLYNKYLSEELSGVTDLHLPIGYIKQVYSGA